MAYIKAETPNAVYFINFELHGNKFFDSIPKKQALDGIASEVAVEMPKFVLYGLDLNAAYKSFLSSKKFEKREVDVFFIDPGVPRYKANSELTESFKKLRRFDLAVNLGKLLALPTGLVTVGKLINDIEKNRSQGKKMSRRTFLKYGSVFSTASIPFALDSFIKSGNIVPTKKGSVSLYRKLGMQFKEFVSDQGMLFTKFIRDAVMAKRLESVVAPHLKKSLGKKPVIGVYVGAAHGLDLKKMLKDPKRRQKFLRKAMESKEILTGPHSPNWLNETTMFKWNASTKDFEGPYTISKPASSKAQNAKRRRFAKAKETKISRRRFLKKFIRA